MRRAASPARSWTTWAASGWAEAAIILLLLAIAVALRAPGLSPESLWLDDAWIALVHKVDDLGVVARMGVTAPGFALLLRGVFAAVGFSEAAAQALPFLAGITAPPVTYSIVRTLGRSRWAALAGATLVMLSPVHILYSTNVKQFTLDLVLALLLLWISWRATRRPADERQAWLAGLALLGVLSILISASVAPVAAVAAVVPALPGLRRREWRFAWWPAAFATCILAWAVTLRGWIPDGLTGYWDDQTSDGVGQLFGAYGRLLESFAGSGLLGAAVLLLGLIGTWRADWALRALLVGPLAIAGLASFVGIPLGTGRTDMYLYGSLAIAAGLGIDAFSIPGRWRALPVVAAALIMAIPFPRPGYGTDGGWMIQNTRPLIEETADLLGPDDTLLTLGSYHATMLYGPWDPEIVFTHRSVQGWSAITSDGRVQTLPWARASSELDERFPAVTAERIFLLWTHLPAPVLEEAEWQLIQQGFERHRERVTDGAELRIYRCTRPGGCGRDA